MLMIVDTFTRLSPAINVLQNFRGSAGAETLEQISRELEYPKTICLHNVQGGEAKREVGTTGHCARASASDIVDSGFAKVASYLWPVAAWIEARRGQEEPSPNSRI